MTDKISFSKATIKNIINETLLAKHLQVEIKNSRIAASYKVPGQYAAIRIPGLKENFFAMTHHPEEKQWEFLIKESSPLTAHLLEMKMGDKLELSMALGKGFAIEKAIGKDVFLFAAGSGISALRPVLLEIFKKRKNYNAVTLFYGARNPDEFAYTRKFPEWEKNEIKISRIISNVEHKEWRGPIGHVQQLIPKKIDPKKTAAFLCGMPEMVEDVTRELLNRGLSKNQILTNT